jgi:pimeloyl-ACP methyl ester carboxylesterase
VILLHGLWMRGIVLAALRHRLSESGYAVETFDYMSVAESPDAAEQRLRKRMQALGGTVHLVGHSLGGLLALRACRDDAGLPPGRIVCLGSPLQGSAGARALNRWGASWLLGQSRNVLEHGLPAWAGTREVGVIAGTSPVGLGSLSEDLGGPHGGTVAVAETRLPGITDHCEVAASHSGLLFSAEAAEQALAFLHDGHFRRDGAGGVGSPQAC